MAQPRAKRTRRDFTLSEKLWFLDYFDRNPHVSAKDLGQALADHINSQRSSDQVAVPGPGKSTVHDWKKISANLIAQSQQGTVHNEQSRRLRAAKFPELEQALALRFRQQEARDLPITNELLCGQAKLFDPQLNVPESFAYSDGWLGNFKKRQGIKQIVKHGEANGPNSHGVELARNAIPKIVNDGGYAAQDIYNQDETAQFWWHALQRSLATCKRAGRKQGKQCITVSLCCNATGTDKRVLFVIGKSKRPRSFPRTSQPERDWGIRYRHNSKAWMMAADFSNWVKDWNRKLQATTQKIMLIVDNAPTHMVHGVTPEQEHGRKVFPLFVLTSRLPCCPRMLLPSHSHVIKASSRATKHIGDTLCSGCWTRQTSQATKTLS
jgi:hypothetical protein